VIRAGRAAAAVAAAILAGGGLGSPDSGGGRTAARRAAWLRRMEELAPATPGDGLPVDLRVSPALEEQAAEDGDTAFATYALRHHRVEVHVAADAPEGVDLVSPALASARFLAAHPAAARRPVLLAGYGAFRAGRWWGRESAEWAAMLHAAGALPDAGELCGDGGVAEAPSLLAVGAAAAAIDVWVRADGEAAVESALAGGAPPVARVRAALAEAGARPFSPPRRRALPAGRLRGVSFAMENSVAGSYLSRSSAATLDRLRSDGANAVSVIPYAFQRSAAAPELRFPGRNPRGETEEGIFRVVGDARARGMAALVKPQIWLWRGFTGDIAMRSDADWAEWFRQYRAYLVRYAVVAEAAGAEMFDVGVELCATERREREWRETIRAIRAATGATLVYSCNWGKGVAAVPFWDALDAIGVDFYDPLSSSGSPTDAELVSGVLVASRPLAAESSRVRRPVYLTEVGFPSVTGAWLAPNEEESPRPFSEKDPARCARAIFAALAGQDWCRGMFWWKAFSDGHDAVVGRKSFNILGVPIETAIREGFRTMAEARD
jgi:hypothetical protein